MSSPLRHDREFSVLFAVMLTLGAGNTALQSVMPAIGRSLALPDSIIALTFSISAFVWMIAAPRWAGRSELSGRKRMVLTGIGGFSVSTLLCAIVLIGGIQAIVTPLVAIAGFSVARIIYGAFGAAAPPAAQALIAGKTSREDRTKALTLLASAFGLGTILGPAVAPFFVLPGVGLAGPALAFSLIGGLIFWVVWVSLPDDYPGTSLNSSSLPPSSTRGAATSYPSIGGNLTGASITAAIADKSPIGIAVTDPRIWPWLLTGLVAGHAQAMIGQTIAFLVIDRLGLSPLAAQPSIALVLMAGASAALLIQWGIIPLFNMEPRKLIMTGLVISGLGCACITMASSLYDLAVAFGLASAGFGFIRPGFTAGASLAVGPDLQGAVAGRVTSVNGAVYVLGPAIGVALYEGWRPLPFLVCSLACGGLALFAARRIASAQ